jgi:hypothetical protein
VTHPLFMHKSRYWILILLVFVQVFTFAQAVDARAKEAVYTYDEKNVRLTPTVIADKSQPSEEDSSSWWEFEWLDDLIDAIFGAIDTGVSWLVNLWKDIWEAGGNAWDAIADWWDSLPDWLRGLLKGLGAALIVVAVILLVVAALLAFEVIAVVGAVVALAIIGALLAGALYGLIVGGDNFDWGEGIFWSSVGAITFAALQALGFFAAAKSVFLELVWMPLKAFWGVISSIGVTLLTAVSRSFHFLLRAFSGSLTIVMNRLGAALLSIWRVFPTFGGMVLRAFTGAYRFLAAGFAGTGMWARAFWQALRTGNLALAGRMLAQGIGHFGRVVLGAGRILLGRLFGAFAALLGGAFRHLAIGLTRGFAVLMGRLYRAGTALWIGINQAGYTFVTALQAFRTAITTAPRWAAVKELFTVSLRPLVVGVVLRGAITNGAVGIGLYIIKYLVGMENSFSFKNLLVDVSLSMAIGAIFAVPAATLLNLWRTSSWGKLFVYTIPFAVGGGMENYFGELLKSGNATTLDFIIGFLTVGFSSFLGIGGLQITELGIKGIEEIIKTGIGNLLYWNDPSKDQNNYLKKFVIYIDMKWKAFTFEFSFQFQNWLSRIINFYWYR